MEDVVASCLFRVCVAAIETRTNERTNERCVVVYHLIWMLDRRNLRGYRQDYIEKKVYLYDSSYEFMLQKIRASHSVNDDLVHACKTRISGQSKKQTKRDLFYVVTTTVITYMHTHVYPTNKTFIVCSTARRRLLISSGKCEHFCSDNCGKKNEKRSR